MLKFKNNNKKQIQMINLKTHNDMIQKMIQQNQKLQAQIKQLNTKIYKLQSNKQIGNLKDKQLDKKNKDQINKINKIHKQYKDKIQQFNKIILSKDLQINQLKQRLEIKMNIDQKQKQHIIQTFRKYQGRKPNSSNDYKLMSIINHYETQIDKKDKTIQKITKEMDGYQEVIRKLKKQLVDKQNDSTSMNVIQKQTKQIQQQMKKDLQTLEIKKLNKQLNRKEKKIECLNNQLKQLRKRYDQLTKDYYKIMNQYGDISKLLKPKQPNKTLKKSQVRQVRQIQDLQTFPQPSQISLEYSIQSQKPKNHQQNLKYQSQFILSQQQFQVNNRNQTYTNILDKLRQIYKVQSYEDLINQAIRMDVSMKNLDRMENCLNLIKTTFQRLFKVRLNFSKIEVFLKMVQEQIGQSLVNSSIIKEMQIKLGMKKNGMLKQLQRIKKQNNEYYESLKTVNYIKNVSISKQIKQFIQFFELDVQQQLPVQITNLYEQLKAVDKFRILCNKLLEIKSNNVSQCLDYVLKTLENMKNSKYQDIDLIRKLQQELNVESYEIIKKVKELKRKREN